MAFFLCVLFLGFLVEMPKGGYSANVACQEVRYAYSAKGMNVYDVPLTPQSGKIIKN
jgi:hypothetical protein